MMKPEIRFNGFNDEWVETQLSEKIEYHQPSKYIVKSTDYKNEGIPVLTAGKTFVLGYTDEDKGIYKNIGGGVILFDDFTTSSKFVNFDFKVKSSAIKILTNDILSTDLKFLFEIISLLEKTPDNHQRQWISSFSKQSVDMPSFPEQQKIGALFSKYDVIIALRQQKLEELNALKKGMLQQMFDDGYKPQVRFSGFNDEWVEKKLGDLASFSRGNGYTKNDLVESGSPIIMYGRLYTKYETIIKNVDTFVKKKANSIISEGFEVIVPASGESSKDISRASAVGMSGLILGGDLNVIKPVNYIDSVFLALTISNGSQQRELSKRAQGKSIVHLHSSDLKQVDFSYPSFPEQQKIGQLFEKLDARISNEQTKIEQLKAQKQGLLQRML